MKSKLTKRSIDALQPTDKRFTVWDTELKGFGVRVNADGSKTFVVKYFFRGRQRWLTLGPFGALTVESARRVAEKTIGSRADGKDAVAEKRRETAEAKAKGLTLSEFCEIYMTDAEAGKVTYRKRPKKPGTLLNDRSRIERHIKPLLGRKRLSEITQADVVNFMHSVRLGKTAVTEKTKPRGVARVRGGDTAASRAVGLLGSIYSYAGKLGFVSENPVRGIEKPNDRRRETALSPDQYKAFGAALDALLAQGANPYAIHAARLLAVTGCRRREIYALKKSEVDAHHSCFRFGDTKTGQQARPIGETAFEILKNVPLMENSEYVFPAARGDGHLWDVKILHKAFELAKLDGMTIHGLRHAFASVAGELGYSDAVIGVMLGHRSNTVTSRYTHIPDPAAVTAADRVSRMVLSRMRGEKASGKVVRMRELA